MVKLRASGGYRDLRAFQMATVIYDATYWFCERYLDGRVRMCDQMIQAARSGRQNIAEGSRAGAVSSQTELRLINVARSSLEELLLDFEDFLRHRRLKQWTADAPEALAIRRVGLQRQSSTPEDPDVSRLTVEARYALYAEWLEDADPAVRANALICLIHQTNYLLDKQIAALERRFIEEGGYSEQLATARITERNRQKACRSTPESHTDRADAIPACPECGGMMVLRTAQKGKNAGKPFWGCASYPDCKGIVNI
jgi:restriction system protein